jgi:putative ABC transport system permease protein
VSVVNRGVRNAFRNEIRSFSIIVILGLSIGLALAMLLAHQAVGQKINSVKSSVGNTITVSPAGFRGFGGGGNPLTQDQMNKVEQINHVSSVSESLNDRLSGSDTNLQSSIDAGALGRRFGGGFGGRDGSPQQTFTPPVTVVGANDPTNLTSAGSGTFKLTGGQVFSSDSSDNVAVVGTALATKNNLNVGSTFTAYGSTIKVVGIFDGGNTFSNGQLIMPLATVQKLSQQPGDITSATVKVDSIDNLAAVTSAIQASLGSAADVTNDQTRSQDTIDSLKSIEKVSLYSLVGAVVAGAVIIFLTMLMIVRERRREIGVLKAIGASNIKIMLQFMTEAITLTVLGAVVGIILGIIAGDPITHMLVSNSSNTSSSVAAANGRAFGGPAGRFAGGGFNSGNTPVGPLASGGFRGFRNVRNNLANIHATVGWSIIAYGLLSALVIAIIGSSVASWFIAKVRPAEVMRVE